LPLSPGVKIAIISKMVVPDIALVDPQTTVTMPAALTAATGMDALCHSFEAYVSSASSAITDMAALRSVQLIVDNLAGAFAHPTDMVYRDNMMMASLMAGLAFSNASLGLVHAMAHSLGGEKNLAHGECNAVLLEAVVPFNFQAAADKYTALAMAMGVHTDGQSPNAVAGALVDRLVSLRRQVGITQRLKDMGVQPDEIAQLSENAAQDPCLATNPCMASAAEIASIYEKIYE
jgi:alcohol dehydrogenase class IV